MLTFFFIFTEEIKNLFIKECLQKGKRTTIYHSNFFNHKMVKNSRKNRVGILYIFFVESTEVISQLI